MSENLPATIPAHLAALTPQQRSFVAEYVRNGGNATKAARDAGYSGGKENNQHHQRAYEVLKSEKVQKAIRVETEEFSAKLAPKAFAVLAQNMDSPDPTVSTKAAAEILDRTGYLKGRKVEHEHKRTYDGVSDEELERRYKNLLAKAAGKIIDITPDKNEATDAVVIEEVPVDDELAALLGGTPSDE